jgi:hypothetical protein
MVTEDQKKARLLKVFNVGMYGMIKGLWDLFGESSFATVHNVGKQMLEMMEQESGLEIAGENPEDILQEITRLLADEIGAISAGEVIIDGDAVALSCQDCFLHETTEWLEKDGIQPFACMPMNISAAAMSKRLGVRHRLRGRDWDEETQTCTIKFDLIE